MGLDITAYSKLRHVGRHTDGWCKDYESHVQAYAHDAFPQSFRGIPVLGERQVGDGDGDSLLEGGCYEITGETQTHAFKAGPYSGYGVWRADLQRQFNPGREPTGPFYELIWFADNEGSIGPEAAADLLADFRAHADRYDPPNNINDWYRSKYQDWMRAFELAADGGLVHFH